VGTQQRAVITRQNRVEHEALLHDSGKGSEWSLAPGADALRNGPFGERTHTCHRIVHARDKGKDSGVIGTRFDSDDALSDGRNEYLRIEKLGYSPQLSKSSEARRCEHDGDDGALGNAAQAGIDVPAHWPDVEVWAQIEQEGATARAARPDRRAVWQ
jgi:hypothetical protein